MSRKTKTCPECGSSAHFRCTAGKHVAMVVRAPQTRHLIDELTAGDLLVIFRKQPLDFPIGPSAPQKVLQPHLRDFVATLGATEVISGDEIAVAGAEVLLVGCGQVDLPGDQYGTQNVPSAVRAACLAFDDALTEAERVHARRVLIDASHILDSAGSPMAAALHCRLQLAEAAGHLPGLQEVVIFARGNLGKRLSRESVAGEPGPICANCPFSSQCSRSTVSN